MSAMTRRRIVTTFLNVFVVVVGAVGIWANVNSVIEHLPDVAHGWYWPLILPINMLAVVLMWYNARRAQRELRAAWWVRRMKVRIVRHDGRIEKPYVAFLGIDSQGIWTYRVFDFLLPGDEVTMDYLPPRSSVEVARVQY